MRQNKKGRPEKTALKKHIKDLYDGSDLSFTEIGEQLGMPRQTVRYHYITAPKED